jgi:hypothetical protein
MSNRDFSHVTRVQQKAAQTMFAGKVINTVSQARIPGYILKGGVPAASVAIATNSGQAAAGETVAPFVANPIAVADRAGTNTTYDPRAAVAELASS